MNKETSEKYNRFKEQCMTMNFLYLTEKYFYCKEENKQLKANIDEVLELLNGDGYFEDDLIISILERGKEC